MNDVKKDKSLIKGLLLNELENKGLSYSLLFFRIALSLELIIVHGLKKLGLNNGVAEVIPNPYGFPQWINDSVALAANFICPVLIILGLFTRLVTLPVLAVTLSGYFIVHGNDSLLVRDVPFMYSICFLFLTFTGAGKYSLDNIISQNIINHD